jgi:hypothetical protein
VAGPNLALGKAHVESLCAFANALLSSALKLSLIYGTHVHILTYLLYIIYAEWAVNRGVPTPVQTTNSSGQTAGLDKAVQVPRVSGVWYMREMSGFESYSCTYHRQQHCKCSRRQGGEIGTVRMNRVKKSYLIS